MYWAWGIFAIITAWIADEKGYSFWSWFFIGLLTGPIGLIILLFLPKVVGKFDEEPRADTTIDIDIDIKEDEDKTNCGKLR